MAVPPTRDDSRIIIHLDYDCFYASVIEAEQPVLKTLPLAIQQKQIIATCNYEARRRGLRKLQLVWEAKKICPDLVVVLGEDLTKFRDASKELYLFLRAFVWGGRVEKLGFDELFLDVTEMIDYTVDILNQNNLGNSFFYLDRLDPTAGFTFDATQFHGPTYPRASSESVPSAAQLTSGSLYTRLLVASHLAGYLRSRLEHQMGYTASAGISTSKLLAKMVGSTHKPNNQTSLLPPYAVAPESGTESSLMNFIDAHEIRKIPGIGSKLAHKLRAYVLAFDPDSNDHLPSPDKKVTVRDIRLFPRMGPVLLEEILGGPGSPKDIGMRVWALIYGVDNSQVIGLLAASVIRRMRIDLTENAKDLPPHSKPERTWVAYPRTLRLSTRFRSPEETHVRSFNRTSRSVPLPQFVFNLGENVGALAERLVRETLVAMFHKLQPHRSGWNVNLLNVAVTNMVDAAGERKHSSGRDIGKMFRTQETVLEDWKVPEPDYPRCQTGGTDIRSFQPQDQPADVSSYPATELLCKNRGSFDASSLPAWNSPDHIWEDSDEDEAIPSKICPICGTPIPYFAEAAHERYHLVPD